MKRLLILILLIGQSACMGTIHLPAGAGQPATAYVSRTNRSVMLRYPPIFLIENSDLPYNRIGTPSLIAGDFPDTPIIVDPGTPTVYFRELSFATDRGTYRNYVYRIHFERVPFSLLPFHLSTGKNVGLIVIITFNQKNEPVLITTVHTCGCYLAFIPTSFLPAEAFPDNWNYGLQKVYGKTLPGLLDLPGITPDGSDSGLVILLESGTHRVKWLQAETMEDVSENYRIQDIHIESMDKLKTLGQDGRTTSFFETSGPRKGHVKGSSKPFERLLMSWWALDLYVGEDKDFGPSEETGTTFYTSLKFWDRTESDMWNFRDFLTYWGWKL